MPPIVTKRMNKESIGTILAFIEVYLPSCLGYIIIRRFMGVYPNDIGLIYLAILFLVIFTSAILKLVFFIKTRTKKFHYTKGQILDIVLAIILSCLLIELFLLEEPPI